MRGGNRRVTRDFKRVGHSSHSTENLGNLRIFFRDFDSASLLMVELLKLAVGFMPNLEH